MRKVPRNSYWLIACGFLVSPAAAQEVVTSQPGVATPIIVPSQSSIYNQNAVNLPSPPVVHGQDIIRGADGTSCQSAIGSGGMYADFGVIGSQDVFNRDTASVYGRIVVPLGKKGKRLDCSKLYELEIARMKMEIEMLSMSAPVGGAAPASATQAQVQPPAFLADAEPAPQQSGALVIPPRDAPLPPASSETENKPKAKAAAPVQASLHSALPPPAAVMKKKFNPTKKIVIQGEETAKPDCEYFAQLGAFSSEDRARARLTTAGVLNNSNTKELVKKRGAIIKTSISKGAVLHRLQMGPMTRAEAEALCASADGDCLLVRS